MKPASYRVPNAIGRRPECTRLCQVAWIDRGLLHPKGQNRLKREIVSKQIVYQIVPSTKTSF